MWGAESDLYGYYEDSDYEPEPWGVEALAEAFPAGLQHLDLADNRFGTRGSAVLAGAFPAGLEHLNLARNAIGPRGAEVLLEAGALPKQRTSSQEWTCPRPHRLTPAP